MPYETSSLKLLARGGQADIYALDEYRILRVLRDSTPDAASMLKNECALMQGLRERGVGVPEVYECTEADGLPAAVLQRVTGPSLMEELTRKPLRMRSIAAELARLHCEFLRGSAPNGLMQIKRRADIIIDQSSYLNDASRSFIRSLLAELPEGDALLHGDFHPGNILSEAGKYYTIDWFGAAVGDSLADVAHTVLLCAYKPRVPSEGFLAYHLLKMAAKRFGGMYLKEMRVRLGFDAGAFGKWLAVRAAERSAYGQPSERKPRAEFVEACRAMQNRGVPPEQWHKAL